MRRRLVNVLTTLSLLLCTVALVLWVRSYTGSDYVSRSRLVSNTPEAVTSRVQNVQWTRGRIRLSDSDLTYYPRGRSASPATPSGWLWGWGRLGRGHFGSEVPSSRSVWNRLGFYAGDGPGLWTSWSDERVRLATIPAWLPVIAFTLPALLRLPGIISAHRRRRGNACAACGYDLRATPGRCPECGDVPAGRQPA